MRFEEGDNVYFKGIVTEIDHYDEKLPYKVITSTDDSRLTERWYSAECLIPAVNIEKAYEQGLNDAWELARKITSDPEDGGLPVSTLQNVFECLGHSMNPLNIFTNCTAAEAIERFKKYENTLIKPGDVVAHDGNPHEYVVIDVDEGVAIRTDLKHVEKLALNSWKRTGRVIDISGLLACAKGE